MCISPASGYLSLQTEALLVLASKDRISYDWIIVQPAWLYCAQSLQLTTVCNVLSRMEQYSQCVCALPCACEETLGGAFEKPSCVEFVRWGPVPSKAISRVLLVIYTRLEIRKSTCLKLKRQHNCHVSLCPLIFMCCSHLLLLKRCNKWTR